MPAKVFGSQIDLRQIPVVGLVPEASVTAPSTPVAGQLWLDTSLTPARLKVYENGAWALLSNSDVQLLSQKGQANGYAALDANAKVPITQLPTGTTATTVVIGNDSRLSDSRTPSGSAGGALSGTYPNPGIAAGAVGATEIASAIKDPAAGTAGLRTLGTGATQAAAGNHTHGLSDLSDVTVTSPATGNVIRWSGTEWTNAALVIGDVSGLQTALNGKSDTGHAHAAGDITSGTFAIARLPVAASGTSSTTQVVRADDSRLSDSRAPSGTAGGDLTGSYPNPTLGTGVVDDTNVAAANKDGSAATPSMRTLGTGAQQALAGNTRLDQLAAPTSAVPLNGQRITSLATPTNDTDAATKAYVDAARSGLDAKESVRVATTGNITLSGTQTIDGVAVVAGDRVLVKNQTTAAQNGIYVVASGAWSRASDADSSAEVSSGMYVFVEEGTAQDNSGWVLSTNNPITLGTTALTFVQFSGTGQINAGAGLTKSGDTLDVVGTANRITVDADSIDIASNYAGQNTITTLGTVATGTWNATTIALNKGGTGATTAAAARTNLGAVGKYAADLGALTAGVEATITHNLNSTDVHAMFRNVSSGYDEVLSWRVINANSIGVTADIGYAASALRVVVMG